MKTPVLTTRNGYAYWDHMHGHPLAPPSGIIPAHRLVLWEHLNYPTESECTWCGYTLPWTDPGHAKHTYRYVVNVDHLDDDKNNNDPANLAPTCWWCNAHRCWAEELIPQDFYDMRRFLTDVHPAARPSLGSWCEIRYGIQVDMKNRSWVFT